MKNYVWRLLNRLLRSYSIRILSCLKRQNRASFGESTFIWVWKGQKLRLNSLGFWLQNMVSSTFLWEDFEGGAFPQIDLFIVGGGRG